MIPSNRLIGTVYTGSVLVLVLLLLLFEKCNFGTVVSVGDKVIHNLEDFPASAQHSTVCESIK